MKQIKNRVLSFVLALLATPVPFAVAQDHAAHTHEAHLQQTHEHPGDLVGSPRDPSQVLRTIQVDTNDSMRFVPASISVKAGEVVRFVVKNDGQLRHEMVIGSPAELKVHAAMMAKYPQMEHAEPNQVTLAPGASGSFVWQFDKAGIVDFACLQPGHFEAGMMGQIKVVSK